MAKRAVKISDGGEPRLRKRATQAPPPPSSTEAAPGAPIEELDLNATLVEARGRVFESEQEALDFFFNRLIGEGRYSAPEQNQMREFLELLLETDPMLKGDLLAAVRVKK